MGPVDIALDVPGGQLDANGRPAAALAHLIDEGAQVLNGLDPREGGGRHDVLPRLPAADAGDLLGDLLSGEVAAHARLGSLADLDLDRVSGAQALVAHGVAQRRYLEDAARGGLALRGEDTALTRAHGRADRGGAAGEGDLGLGGERAEGHSAGLLPAPVLI